MTKSEQKTLNFIRHFIKINSLSPTLDEIASGIGIASKGTVSRYVNALIDHGHLRKKPVVSRGLELAEAAAQHFRLPLLGKIAAGRPIEAIPGEDELDLSEFFYTPDFFVLQVEGDSMIEEGIFDGDYVICQRAHMAEVGDIVVALVDEESATLKRFQRDGDRHITLVPENSEMQPMTYSADRVTIQGIYHGLFRRAA